MNCHNFRGKNMTHVLNLAYKLRFPVILRPHSSEGPISVSRWSAILGTGIAGKLCTYDGLLCLLLPYSDLSFYIYLEEQPSCELRQLTA